MSLQRDLVSFASQLRHDGINPFAPSELAELVGALGSTDLTARIARMGPMSGDNVAVFCLQALHLQHENLLPQLQTAELVATLPSGVPGIARTTDAVVREMLRPGVNEVILLGYELTDRSFFDSLVSAGAHGADIILICDRQKGGAERVKAGWPDNVRPPRIFVDQERKSAAPYASMHAKCLLVDANDLLITSANFTFHGLHGNIEIGIRLSGGAGAEARKMFSYLVDQKLVMEQP